MNGWVMRSLSSFSRILFCACLLALPSSSFGSLINGDFSSLDFTGWQGEVTDIFINTTFVDPFPNGFSENFDASSGQAILTTSTIDTDIFSVFMFQQFALDTVAAGESLLLSYDLSAVLTDQIDAAFAQLNYGPSFSNAIDLFSTPNVDVTFLAGQNVELFFGVEDLDDLNDSLTVDNLVISRTTRPISEPSVLFLLSVGLAGWAVSARRNRSIC